MTLTNDQAFFSALTEPIVQPLLTGGDQKNLQIQMKGTEGTKELQSSIGSLTNKPKCHWMSGVEESPFDRVTKLLTFTTG